MTARSFAAALVLLPLATGCHRSTPADNAAQAAERRAALDSDRQQLELIPPPSKTRYMAVHSLDTWENPYLTIQPDMVTIHVLQADANPTTIGLGGMTRPIAARRQDLNVSLDKLPEAITAIPHSAWPYGRVVSVEEAHKTPPAGRPAVRREMEATLKALNDLGIVVYEWTENGPAQR